MRIPQYQIYCASALCAWLWLGAALCAQDTPDVPERRPTIGLVLSGGGARGAAHVGVLKTLEELHIPIDYIAGTSMGAVIGGLYAYGKSPTEIDTLIRDADWKHLFSDRSSRPDRPWRDKRADADFLVKFTLGFDDGQFRIPKGVLEGQNIQTMLDLWLIDAYRVTDFDALPIPLRVVATDIQNGAGVTLGSGRLSKAIRASMGIPTMFSPVEIGGRWLVDGVVADGLPIDVARAMGADIVIAVDVSTPLGPFGEQGSLFQMNWQVNGVLMRKNIDRQRATIAGKDVLLTPALGDITPLDFDRVAEARRIGITSALELSNDLSALSLSPAQYDTWLARHRRTPTEPPIIDRIQIETDAGIAVSVLENKLRTRAGEPLDLQILRQDLAEIYGLGAFDLVEFILRRADTSGPAGRVVLVITAKKSFQGTNRFRFGLELLHDFEGISTFDVAVEHRMTEINGWGGEWRNVLQLGDTERAFTEFHQPTDADGFTFVALNFEYLRFPYRIYEQGDQVAEFRVATTQAGLDLGCELGKWGELRTGARYTDGDGVRTIGSPLFRDLKFQTGNWFLNLGVDTLDQYNFPSRGHAANLQWSVASEALGSQTDYELLHAYGYKAASYGNHIGVGLLRGGTTIKDEANVADPFALGGMFALSGYRTNELRGAHHGLAALIYAYRLGGSAAKLTDLPMYVGSSIEIGNVWSTRDAIKLDSSLKAAGSLWFGIDSLMGPAYLMVGFAEGGQNSVLLFFGTPFRGG